MQDGESLNSLKELINMRFDELEKRMKAEAEYEKNRNAVQDERLNDHTTRIRTLENIAAGQATREGVKLQEKKTTWDKIKDSFISWVVPFVMMAVIYYMARGGSR